MAFSFQFELMNAERVAELAFARYERLIALNRREGMAQRDQIRTLQGRLAKNTRMCCELRNQLRYMMNLCQNQRAVCEAIRVG